MTSGSITRDHVLRDYYAFLARKKRSAEMTGLDSVPALNESLFGYQADTVDFLLRSGRGAAFLDTGMGKSFIFLEWGRVIVEHTNKPVLALAPLAVGPQHEREAERFGIDAKYIRTPDQITTARVYICNYERLHLFDPAMFGGLILDESSIVKNFTGKTSRALIEFGSGINYLLAATATPAPNDHMELGQHSAFLGAMASNEMLARWFTADQSAMGKYRLKKYGVNEFWSWVASWARMASRPSDLGHSDEGFELPKLNQYLHYVSVDLTEGKKEGELFRHVDTSATKIHAEKRMTAGNRADEVARIVSLEPDESWVIWCDTDYEADALNERIPGAVEVRGSMRLEVKEERLNAFSSGEIKQLITKPSVAGFGLNWQHCARSAFVGVSFSYEALYQALRRLWRFGQQRTVDAHIVMAETESIIWQTIQRKARDHEMMKTQMNAAMRRAVQESEVKITYRPTMAATLPEWLK